MDVRSMSNASAQPLCRWCKRPIESSALKCHHCRTWQRDGADVEEVRKAQILDEGIIKWGKFLAGLGLVLAALILAAGGFDLYHAREAAVEAKIEAEKSKNEATLLSSRRRLT